MFGPERFVDLDEGLLLLLVDERVTTDRRDQVVVAIALLEDGRIVAFRPDPGSMVAAVLLAVELLLFEWKPRSAIPVALASVTAVIAGILAALAEAAPNTSMRKTPSCARVQTDIRQYKQPPRSIALRNRS